MTKQHSTRHVVVDGSNIATEGRSTPSLAQLNEAVTTYMAEHPEVAVTVVVDATFGHRIDNKERKEYDEAVANNELVAPPAGAVGRGDAFVLGIADKADATVLSNDSFQEFHGQYDWLFDEGRLVGGKPVPHVGWVFVDRVPVRGPVSKKATKAAKQQSSRRGSTRRPSTAASQPMPVPSSPPPSPRAPEPAGDGGAARRPAPKGNEPVNELMPFLDFVEHHPVGTSVNGTVDAYSSHGAYVTIGDSGVRGYVPLRLMSDPPPRSARKVMKLGESVTVVVVSFAPARRSIDCAMPDMASAALAGGGELVAEGAVLSEDATTSQDEAAVAAAEAEADVAAAGARKRRKQPAAKKAAAKKVTTKRSAAQKTATKKSAAKRTATKETATKKTAAGKAGAKKTATKKTAAGKAGAKKTATKKTAAGKAAAKKTATKKTAAKKTAATRRRSRASAERES